MGEPPPAHAGRRLRFAIVACARGEKDYVQEWLDYHRSVGFEHVFLYGNDDHPGALLARLGPYLDGPDPFVTFVHWPPLLDHGERTVSPREAQANMYIDCLHRHAHRVDWLSFLDLDEFLVFPGRADVAAFMRAYEADTDCLYLNWIMYGNSGRLVRDDGSVLMSYVHRRADADIFTKLICRPGGIDPERLRRRTADGSPAPFWHGLDPFDLGMRCRNVLHEDMGDYWSHFPADADAMLDAAKTPALLDTGYVAHFAYKSEADFGTRRQQVGTGRNASLYDYVVASGAYRDILRQQNAVFDDTLARYWYDRRWRRLAAALPSGRQDPPNVALHKPCWQSSVADVPAHAAAPSRAIGWANSGVATGGFGFCTAREADPFWIVDLLDPFTLERLVIYNRGDDPAAAAEADALEVWVSLDNADWTPVFARRDTTSFGGVGGEPLIVRADGVVARFVKLRLNGEHVLHLDEVEIYGRPLPTPALPPSPRAGWSERLRRRRCP